MEQRRLLSANGFDLNEGIVVQAGGMWHSGGEAAHALASLHGGTNLLDRFVVWCFRSRRRAELVYPAFRACRRLLLLALNRRVL